MTYSIKTLALATVAATVGLTGAAMADADDVRNLAEAKISLVEAINAAEKHQGGKAYEANIDDDSFKPEYEVTVVKDNVSYEVSVDGVSGEVLGVRQDRD